MDWWFTHATQNTRSILITLCFHYSNLENRQQLRYIDVVSLQFKSYKMCQKRINMNWLRMAYRRKRLMISCNKHLRWELIWRNQRNLTTEERETLILQDIGVSVIKKLYCLTLWSLTILYNLSWSTLSQEQRFSSNEHSLKTTVTTIMTFSYPWQKKTRNWIRERGYKKMWLLPERIFSAMIDC